MIRASSFMAKFITVVCLKSFPALFFAVLAVLICVTCAGRPSVEPDVHRISLREQVRAAPDVFLAKVTSVQAIGCLRRSAHPGQELQLVRVSLIPQEVLRGNVTGSPLLYYFRWAGQGYDGPELNSVVEGEESVFLARPEHGVLRALTDLYLSRVRLPGKGKPASTDASQPVERRIAEMLLSPREGQSASDFADALHDGYSRAVEVVGEPLASEFLAKHSADADLQVREEACLVKAENDPYSDACLLSLLRSPNTNSCRRRTAEVLLARNRPATAELRLQLSRHPIGWLDGREQSVGKDAVVEELQRLSTHDDALIRRRSRFLLQLAALPRDRWPRKEPR
jgi:hypothetical protein